MNIFALMTLSTLTVFAVPAQEASNKLLDDAEAIMFSSCLQNKARSISQCSCYTKGVKKLMPKVDYHFFMEALYFSSTRDKAGFDKVMIKYGKKLEDLDAMSSQVAEIGVKIESECSTDKNIGLPKPSPKKE